MSVAIEAMTPGDWEEVWAIYREGIATGQATFETEVLPWDEWDAAHHRFARLVARLGTTDCQSVVHARLGRTDCQSVSHARLGRTDCQSVLQGRMVGWAALSPISRRRCYAGVAEVSVYVAAAHRNRGIGRQLLSAVVAESERHGLWTLQGATFPEKRQAGGCSGPAASARSADGSGSLSTRAFGGTRFRDASLNPSVLTLVS